MHQMHLTKLKKEGPCFKKLRAKKQRSLPRVIPIGDCEKDLLAREGLLCGGRGDVSGETNSNHAKPPKERGKRTGY